MSNNKPTWVNALEAAEHLLRKAENEPPEAQHALNRLAETWLAVAHEYREQAKP